MTGLWMCYAGHNGPGSGAYNNVVYDSDGVTPKRNIYMMDSNKWYRDCSVSGVSAQQSIRLCGVPGKGAIVLCENLELLEKSVHRNQKRQP